MEKPEFKVGDKIRAYDFPPSPDRPNRYIIGEIFEVGPYHVAVNVIEDTLYDQKREEVLVPIKMVFDYEGRITKVQ